MWTKTEDGSIIDCNRRVIYFSTQRFVRDICEANCCFVCGANPDEKQFNDEHIFPRWLLRRFDLHPRKLVLPNDAPLPYVRLTVPCCAECNTLMGKEIEEPVSKVIAGGADSINDFITNGGLLKLYVWMGLIFLKIHLKDREFRFHLDARKSNEKISDLQTWEELHHLHCVVRCFYNGCHIEPEALGSFLALEVRQDASHEMFDFVDFSHAQTLMLRIDDIAMISVFNDSGAVMSHFWPHIERITGAVSDLQLREIVAEFAFLSLHLKCRSTFHSEINFVSKTYSILAKRPTEVELDELDYSVRGDLLHRAIRHGLSSIQVAGHTEEEILGFIKAGELSLLFDNDGKFIEKSLIAPRC